MKYAFACCGLLLAVALCVGMAGCSRAPAQSGGAEALTVMVSHPVEKEVTDYADNTGRLAAIDSVEVRAHVWGYLDKVNFKEGAFVKKGDVLFELDDRPYKASLDAAKAKVAQDEAQLSFDEAEYQRNVTLAKTGATSRSDLDKSAAARAVDIANIAADKAQVESRDLDLQYTKIIAPVSGRVSRTIVTVGNLVQSGDQGGGTLLTTIVSVDPIWAYFDVDERTVQYVRRLIREGKAKSARDVTWTIRLALATDTGFPHVGTIDFVDNQVNPKTGTLRIRGVFPNKDEILTPGFFVRVRVPIGFPYKALLVSDRVIDTDQGQKIVYVVNSQKQVAVRPVTLGKVHDGLRVIDEGLKPDDLIIVDGIQSIRPGITVEPKLVSMPGQKPETQDSKPAEVSKAQ